jgi:hypothetical protein
MALKLTILGSNAETFDELLTVHSLNVKIKKILFPYTKMMNNNKSKRDKLR